MSWFNSLKSGAVDRIAPKGYITVMARSTIHIPVSGDLKTTLEHRAVQEGYGSVEAFLRDLLDQDDLTSYKLPDPQSLDEIGRQLQEAETSPGRDARAVLEEMRRDNDIPSDT